MNEKESHFDICIGEQTIYHQEFDFGTTQAVKKECNPFKGKQVKGQQVVGKKQATASLKGSHRDRLSKDR